jgi:hypothetical protein
MLANQVEVSIDVIKKACSESRITPEEHFRSFQLLEPFLDEFVHLNPGSAVDVDWDSDTQEFKGFAVVMPYVAKCIELEYSRPIYGLDVAHMKPVKVDNGGVFLKPMYLTIISGRTLDNHMLICGFCVTFSESSEDIRYLYTVMVKAGVNLNTSKLSLVSDRGTPEILFVDTYLPHVFHFFCGLHLERNLISRGWQRWLALYWNARNAPTKVEHEKCMRVIQNQCVNMYDYLSTATRWQRYLALESNHMLFDWKTDNIVEQVFAWCRRARFLDPLMFLKVFLSQILCRHDEYRTELENLSSVLHPQAIKHFEVIAVLIVICYYHVTLCECQGIQRALIITPLEVHVTDTVRGCAHVHRITDSQERSITIDVDLSRMHCGCGSYQQTGIPCVEAWAVIKQLGIPTAQIFSEAYFDSSCFSRKLQSMFNDVPSLIGRMPTDGNVEERLCTKEYRSMRAPLHVDNKTDVSFKRIASAGDSSVRSNSAISKTAYKKAKIECQHCKTVLSRSSKHPHSRCAKNCTMKGLPVPEIVSCDTII